MFNGGVASNLEVTGSGATEQVNSGGTLAGGSVLTSALEYILGSGSNIVVIGTYTVGSFHTSVDGTGGTIITDPPISSGSGVASPH